MLCLPSYGMIEAAQLKELDDKLMNALSAESPNEINAALKNIVNACGDEDKEYRLETIRSELIKMNEFVFNVKYKGKNEDASGLFTLIKDSKISELLINEITNACSGNKELLLKIKAKQNTTEEEEPPEILMMAFGLAATTNDINGINLLIDQTIRTYSNDKELLLGFINVEVLQALKTAAYHKNLEIANLLLVEITKAYSGDSDKGALLKILNKGLVGAAYNDDIDIVRQLLLPKIVEVCGTDKELLLDTICTVLTDIAHINKKEVKEALEALLNKTIQECKMCDNSLEKLNGYRLKTFRDKNGNTVLHLALMYGRNTLAEKFLEEYPDLISIENSKHESPIDIADKYGNIDGVKLCLEYIAYEDSHNKFFQIFEKVIGTEPYHLSKDMARFYQPGDDENKDKLVIILNLPLYTTRSDGLFDESYHPVHSLHFEKSKVPVLVIGNERHSLSYQLIEESIKKHISKLPKKIILIISGHGNIDQDGDHIINFDITKYKWKTKELFVALKSIFNDKPIEVLLTACHGGGAIKDVDKLPKGSTLLVFSQDNKTVMIGDSESMFKSSNEENYQDAEKFSLQHFLKTYLFSIKETNNIPELAVSGAAKDFDYTQLMQYLGHKFHDSQKKAIVNTLKSYCAIESSDCESKILEVINKIETSGNINDIKATENIYKKYTLNPSNEESSSTDFWICSLKSNPNIRDSLYERNRAEIDELCKADSPSEPFFGIALAVLHEVDKVSKLDTIDHR